MEVPRDIKGKLAVKVEGPHSEAKVDISEKDGVYSVSYMPTEPGHYRVHVTLDGLHIPGSIFEVPHLAPTHSARRHLTDARAGHRAGAREPGW